MTTALAPNFKEVFCSDAHDSLILMWQKLQQGWEPPSDITEEQYASIRNSESSALKGFVGFGPSWGGKWFGGYARGGERNYADETKRSLLRDVNRIRHVRYGCVDYRQLPIDATAVLYADPPYANSTEYRDSFSNEHFWDVMRQWRNSGAHVFVSEYVAPADWLCIWQQARTRDMRGNLITSAQVIEKLFV